MEASGIIDSRIKDFHRVANLSIVAVVKRRAKERAQSGARRGDCQKPPSRARAGLTAARLPGAALTEQSAADRLYTTLRYYNN